MKALLFICSGLMFIGLMDLPIGYYTFLRIVVTPAPDSFNKVKTIRIAKLTNTNTITFPILIGLFNFAPTLKGFQHALFYIIILNLSIFTIAHISLENILIFLKIRALSQNFS